MKCVRERLRCIQDTFAWKTQERGAVRNLASVVRCRLYWRSPAHEGWEGLRMYSFHGNNDSIQSQLRELFKC